MHGVIFQMFRLRFTKVNGLCTVNKSIICEMSFSYWMGSLDKEAGPKVSSTVDTKERQLINFMLIFIWEHIGRQYIMESQHRPSAVETRFHQKMPGSVEPEDWQRPKAGKKARKCFNLLTKVFLSTNICVYMCVYTYVHTYIHTCMETQQ